MTPARFTGRPVRGAWAVLAALSLLAAAACSDDGARTLVQRIVDDLAAGRFAAATSRYRAQEERILTPAAAPAWRRALEHQDATVREWAVDALSRIGRPEDVVRLESALADRARDVRRAAMEGLVRMDRRRAAAIFRERLQDPRPALVAVAADGLARLGDRRAVPALLARFRDASLPSATRATIAQALATLADPAAADTLAGAALDPGLDAQLRRMAAEALLALEGDHRDWWERLARADDAYVRKLAEEALEAQG